MGIGMQSELHMACLPSRTKGKGELQELHENAESHLPYISMVVGQGDFKAFFSFILSL